ncbi:MAG: glucose-1-phosphate cytidylyltransferase [Acidimicrobiia bacterium]
MKAVILAGGRGSRLSEETGLRPKPLVEIGGRPIIWHIMQLYAFHGITDFVVPVGYKGYLVKEYFANLALHNSDVTVDVAANTIAYHGESRTPWRVTVADTGGGTMTAGRLSRVHRYIGDETFCLTYGDGVADVDIEAVIRQHLERGHLVTMTAVQPKARFGTFERDGYDVVTMREKHEGREALVNGGFFVVEPAVFDRVHGDDCIWESDVLPKLASERELGVYEHRGFWQPMDTLWERELLEELWASGRAPWKVW